MERSGEIETSRIHLVCEMSGGGLKKSNIKLKSAKASKVKVVLQASEANVPAMEKAAHVMSVVAQTTAINPQEMLLGLPAEKLLEMKDFMNNNKSHIDVKLDKLCEFTEQYAALETAKTMVAESQGRLSFLVKDAMMNKYATVGDMVGDIDEAIKWKFSQTSQPSTERSEWFLRLCKCSDSLDCCN